MMSRHDSDSSSYDFSTNYDLKTKLGAGAFSDVWLCVKRDNGKEMAAKILKKDYGSSEVNVAMLNAISEVKISKTVGSHPFLLMVEGAYFNRECEKIVIVTELMTKTLFDVIKDDEFSLTQFRIKIYTYQMLEGLKYLHGNDFIHRDIKPENVLLRSRDRFLKIGDFGSSCHVSEGRPHAEYVATRWYRSPECILTRGWYGKKMDIWAVGCVLYEMVTGQAMFSGEDEYDQMDKIDGVLGRPGPRLMNRFGRSESDVFARRYRTGSGHARRSVNANTGCGLHAVYPPHWPAYDVLKDMIVYDPARRFSAKCLLRKPYFKAVQNTPYQRKIANFEKSLQQNGVADDLATRENHRWSPEKRIQSSINNQQGPNGDRVQHVHADTTQGNDKLNSHEDYRLCNITISKTSNITIDNKNKIRPCPGINKKIGHSLEIQSIICSTSHRTSRIKIINNLANRPPFK